MIISQCLKGGIVRPADVDLIKKRCIPAPPVALCYVYAKDTLSIYPSDRKIVNQMHDLLPFRIFGVTVSDLVVKRVKRQRR